MAWILDHSLWTLVATLALPAWMATVCGSPRFTGTFPHAGWGTRFAFLAWCGVSAGSWWYLPSVLPWLLFLTLGVWALIMLVDRTIHLTADYRFWGAFEHSLVVTTTAADSIGTGHSSKCLSLANPPSASSG